MGREITVKKRKFLLLVGALAFPLAFGNVALAEEPDSPIGAPLIGTGAFCTQGAAITGTGATFANNAHQTVFIPEYVADCGKGSVTYTSTGSGAGKFATIERTHDFGMSDEPLSTDELVCATLDLGFSAPANGTCKASPSKNRVSPLHTIPLALGAITVPYNLGTICAGQPQLNFRSPVLGAIFSGLVTKWNDPLLVQDNPTLAGCNRAIKIAVRQDGSGTTYAFKDYLSKRNPQFQVYKQNQLNTAWPAQDLGLNTPLRGNGNGGVADQVKNNPGAIGYVELSTARSKGLVWGKADGPHAQFLAPDQGAAANCDEAATGATHPLSTLSPGWDVVSITDTPNPTAYPICTFTYAFVYNNLKSAFGTAFNAKKAQTLADYLLIALDADTQAKLNTKGYGKLPDSMRTVAMLGVATITDQL